MGELYQTKGLITDFNITDQGCWEVDNNTLNLPENAHPWGLLINRNTSNGGIVQTYFPDLKNAGLLFRIRLKRNDTFKPWYNVK